jgi:fumarate reductase subunit C
VSDVRTEALLWYGQRVSAVVLTLCVAVHLAGIIYAVHGGLTAAEILGRTRGNWAFGAFYAVFVVACAVHAPIGVATIVGETTVGRGSSPLVIASVLGAAILVMGLSAVYGLVAT